jgi:hypothetical protein
MTNRLAARHSKPDETLRQPVIPNLIWNLLLQQQPPYDIHTVTAGMYVIKVMIV